MGKTSFYSVTPGSGIESWPSLAEALAARQQGGYAWLDCVDPSAEQLAALAAALGLHRLSIEDCLDEQQVPKIDDFPNHTFLLLNLYSYADKTLTVSEVDFFLGRDFLVTVSGHGGTSASFHEGLEASVRLGLTTARRGPDLLLQTILDHTVDGKVAAIEAVEDDIDAAEDAMLRDPTSFQLQDLMLLRRALLSLRKSLFHEREVLGRICRRDCPFVSEAAIYDFRDVYDHLTKFFELIEMNRDIVASLTEVYLSLINNQMAKAANETNLSMRRLTLITTIFMPLTLLAGIGGMSEWSMMTGPENWPTAYAAFLVAMVVIAVANYYVLKRLESGNHRSRE